jgi:hypothetical protein
VVIRDWGLDRAGWLVTGTVLLVGLALVADRLSRGRRVHRTAIGGPANGGVVPAAQYGQVQPATSGMSAPSSRV